MNNDVISAFLTGAGQCGANVLWFIVEGHFIGNESEIDFSAGTLVIMPIEIRVHLFGRRHRVARDHGVIIFESIELILTQFPLLSGVIFFTFVVIVVVVVLAIFVGGFSQFDWAYKQKVMRGEWMRE